MGGTFDHLHVGHQLLLSEACHYAIQEVRVGIYDSPRLIKSTVERMEDYETRYKNVENYMKMYIYDIFIFN